MSRQLLFLLLIVGALVSLSEGQSAYDELSEVYKKGVDLALAQLKSHASVRHNFLFFQSLSKSSNEAGFGVNDIRHNFYLKPTKCSKDTVNPDPKRCPFRNDRPMIDCAVCYKTHLGRVESDPKPYLNCVHKPAMTEDVKAKRVQHCDKMFYHTGTITLLGSTGEN